MKYQESEDSEAVNLDKISNRDLEEKIRLMKLQIRGIQGGSDDFPAQSEDVIPTVKMNNQAEAAEESSDFDDGRDLQKLVE